MRYTFKAFFQDPDEADLAYGRLRERGLVEDVQIQSRPTEKMSGTLWTCMGRRLPLQPPRRYPPPCCCPSVSDMDGTPP